MARTNTHEFHECGIYRTATLLRHQFVTYFLEKEGRGKPTRQYAFTL